MAEREVGVKDAISRSAGEKAQYGIDTQRSGLQSRFRLWHRQCHALKYITTFLVEV
jgi:hypothetical protein